MSRSEENYVSVVNPIVAWRHRVPSPGRSQDGRRDGRTVRQWLPDVVSDIVTKVDPVRIILFGSAARDQTGPDSDLDLMVVLDELEPEERPRLMGKIRFAIRAPLAIDVFVTDLAECERRKDVVGSLHYGRFARAR